MIVTIQNGLGAAERIAQSIDPRNVVIGVAGGFGASVRGPGHVHHNGMELIRLGEMTGPVTPRLERVAEVWNDAGFRVRSEEHTSELQSLMRISYAVFCLKKNSKTTHNKPNVY